MRAVAHSTLQPVILSLVEGTAVDSIASDRPKPPSFDNAQRWLCATSKLELWAAQDDGEGLVGWHCCSGVRTGQQWVRAEVTTRKRVDASRVPRLRGCHGLSCNPCVCRRLRPESLRRVALLFRGSCRTDAPPVLSGHLPPLMLLRFNCPNPSYNNYQDLGRRTKLELRATPMRKT